MGYRVTRTHQTDENKKHDEGPPQGRLTVDVSVADRRHGHD